MSKVDKGDVQEKQTTVEEGTQFKGTLSSTCQVMVRGVVDGDLSAPSVIVSESGTVTGNVKAEVIRSEGVLAGRVDATDVYLSGSVRSDTVIRAKSLEIKLQRSREKLEVTFGECILEVGDDPNLETSEPVQNSSRKQPARRANASASDAEDKSKNGAEEGSENGSSHRSVPPPPS
jgi:cytoskeletal protein CcmA (bactofilin family)